MDESHKAFRVELRCGCGAEFFVECPTGHPYKSEFFELATTWTKHHGCQRPASKPVTKPAGG